MALMSVAPSCFAKLSCSKGQIRILSNAEWKHSPAEYCYNSDFTVFVSPSCNSSSKKKCLAFTHQRKFEVSELSSFIGTPGFRLCRLMNGAPDILDFEVNKKWHTLDRCVFTDGSFVDTGSLMGVHLHGKDRK
ncbi:hypothetical protein D3C87_1372320 [compost metagenome]